MFASSPVALLMLVLVADTSAAARTCPPPGESEGRCIELTADGPDDEHEVQISLGLPTSFLFDSDVRVDGVTLEPRDRFEVAPGKRLISLVPLDKGRGEKPGRLTVCFADGAAPRCVTFSLVDHPAIADRQVMIVRRPRPVDSYRDELKKSYEENARLRTENARLRAERDGPDGLTGMFVSGMMDGQGIPCSSPKFVQRPGDTLRGKELITCRSLGRRVTRVQVVNPEGAVPWRLQGARLVGPKGEELKTSMWSEKVIPSADWGHVWVEVAASEVRTGGPFTLKLWEDGPRSITLGNITFP